MIDWSKFDKSPECTVTCGCDTTFRSHAKAVMTPYPHMESRKPCPGCGSFNRIRRIESDPERWSV